MTHDPLEIFRELLERAVESCVEPDAMVLSS
jgi:pyridoxine/pyridoxamine 5'-phosphate oxidase